ncbi:MAG: outer membrane beta-barrel protein, partial [Paludibacter sp.]|nr:outer membrane beta-barrel protein [Paludibacter sp.]
TRHARFGLPLQAAITAPRWLLGRTWGEESTSLKIEDCFDLKNNLSLLTGVLYSVVYSDKLQGYPNSATVTYKTLGHFLDIPLRINYTFPITKNLSVFGFAGPNINIGLYQGQTITSTQTYLPSNPLYVAPGFTELYKASLLNRLNLQIGAGGGVQWNKYQLKGGYDFGITNLNKMNTGNLYQKGWYVSFVYQF